MTIKQGFFGNLAVRQRVRSLNMARITSIYMV